MRPNSCRISRRYYPKIMARTTGSGTARPLWDGPGKFNNPVFHGRCDFADVYGPRRCCHTDANQSPFRLQKLDQAIDGRFQANSGNGGPQWSGYATSCPSPTEHGQNPSTRRRWGQDNSIPLTSKSSSLANSSPFQKIVRTTTSGRTQTVILRQNRNLFEGLLWDKFFVM